MILIPTVEYVNGKVNCDIYSIPKGFQFRHETLNPIFVLFGIVFLNNMYGGLPNFYLKECPCLDSIHLTDVSVWINPYIHILSLFVSSFQSRLLEDASLLCNSWSARQNVS